MLVFDMKHVADDANEPAPFIVPCGLADALGCLYLWSGPESLLSIGDPDARYEPDVVPWASAAVRESWRDFRAVVKQQGDDQPDMEDFYSRCSETALRLATVRAAGRWGRGATVELSDMEWGIGITWTAAQRMATAVHGHTPESERSIGIARMASWARRRYAELGRPITKREFQVKEGGNVKTSEFKERFEYLLMAGIIKPEGGGFAPG
jgi:hypothetical protein